MAKRKSTIPSYKRRRRKSLAGRIVGWIVKLIGAFLILSVLWALAYRFINPPITPNMIGDIVSGRGANRSWMGINSIDRNMARAAIAAEDSRFCSHHGFDFNAIEDALKRNASEGRIRGGSTISQQTAKNVFLWNGGGYVRKGAEAWFTVLIEHLWGKRRIMEVYLNVAETGIGTYGVNAGSERYFGHDASAMTLTEASRIAAVLPLPKVRGAIAPKGFTRRYGNIIAARIPIVARDGLDSCLYQSGAPSVTKAKPTPPTLRRPVPGEEYESAAPLTAAPKAKGRPMIETNSAPPSPASPSSVEVQDNGATSNNN